MRLQGDKITCTLGFVKSFLRVFLAWHKAWHLGTRQQGWYIRVVELRETVSKPPPKFILSLCTKLYLRSEDSTHPAPGGICTAWRRGGRSRRPAASLWAARSRWDRPRWPAGSIILLSNSRTIRVAKQEPHLMDSRGSCSLIGLHHGGGGGNRGHGCCLRHGRNGLGGNSIGSI